MNNATYIVDVKQDPDNPDDVYIELPITILEELGLGEGDELTVLEADSGRIVLAKK